VAANRTAPSNASKTGREIAIASGIGSHQRWV
jgi:hypothetical protein